jgi:hypothetical protein
MTYKKRETMRDLARYMVGKYATIERIRRQDEQRKREIAARREAEQSTTR